MRYSNQKAVVRAFLTVIVAAIFFASATASSAQNSPIKGTAPHHKLQKQKFCHGALHAKIYCKVQEQRIAIKKVDKKVRHLASVKLVKVHLEKVKTWNLHKLQDINSKHRRIFRKLMSVPQPSPVEVYQNYACEKALQIYGWVKDQCTKCLIPLWTKESGFDPSKKSVNASSGAGGIPQALPPSKMGLGDHWDHFPLKQMLWGLGYIHSRWITPCAAWANSVAYSWY